jgi:death-on-curing protein
MDITYISLDRAVEIHSKTVDLSGGGTKGKLNLGPLDSVLQHIQNDLYYPEFEDKLTHLFFSACKFHCFQDGNKRIAIVLCAQMLLLNGYLHCSERFLREMENISYHVASGAISKDFLREIMEAVINDEMDDEDLKLRLIEAMRNSDHED